MKTTPTQEDPRLWWFAGNKSALDLYLRLVFIAHAWDDLIDQDRQVDVNALMLELLLYLPVNECYRQYEGEMRALVTVGIVGYLAANRMEKAGDAHRLELAHYLRYSVVGVATFLIAVLNGVDQGSKILAEAMPTMIPERLAEYVKEHSNAE